jgi:hypothetical protein
MWRNNTYWIRANFQETRAHAHELNTENELNMLTVFVDVVLVDVIIDVDLC